MGMRWTREEYQRYLQATDGIPQEERPIFDKQAILDAMDEVDNKEPALARAIVRPEPKFASKTERRAWYEWIPTTNAVLWYYEPFRLYLNSGSYRPDFALVMPDRTLQIIEVKGHWDAYISGRSSKKSVKEAAKMYWWLAKFFTLLPVKGGGWDCQEIK